MMMRMAVIVLMVVIVVMSMAVRMVVMMVMIVAVVVTMAVTCDVGAFRFKRRFDRLELRSEGLQRLFERGVTTQAHAILLDFDRYVTVAEVPRQSCQRRGIVDAHFEQSFGFRDDLHDAAVIKQQRVVGAKTYRLRKIEFDAGAFHAEEKSALRLALRKWKNERVDHAARLAFG